VGEFRVSYDVIQNTAQVLAIIPKSMAPHWLEEAGEES
jgi:hypothetical protein